MGIIHRLPAEIAGRIAAGEVIERPASVVKELVENSIDAGATRIRILTEQGGHKLIQVIDNGKGMDREDAMLCLEAHATSKIRTEADVGQIHTLGFRGEALPSISSVSRFELQTRPPESLTGTEVIVNNGVIADVRDCGCAPGTSIKVGYLFGNLPARRKFLRGPATEDDKVSEMLLLLALSRPDIGFELTQNGRTTLRATATHDLATRLQMLLGKDTFAAMLPVEYTEDSVHVYGFVSKPGFTRSSRREQRVVINGRAATADTVHFAIRDAYGTLVPSGRYPGVVLYLDLAPDRVDVNVHPTKREVRFRDPMRISAIVAAALRAALRGMVLPPAPVVPAVPAQETPPVSPAVPATAPPAFTPIQSPLEFAARPPDLPAPTAPAPPPPAPLPPAPGGLDFRLLAPLGNDHLLAESPSGLIVVNIKAASQRILFERLLANLRTAKVPQQQLLLPQTVQLAPTDARLLSTELPHFQALGYTIEPFGANAFLITAIPANLADNDIGAALADILADLRHDSVTNRRSAIHLAQTASRHAIQKRDRLTRPEQEALLQELVHCQMPYTDPAGLPTMLNITYAELRKRFQS